MLYPRRCLEFHNNQAAYFHMKSHALMHNWTPPTKRAGVWPGRGSWIGCAATPDLAGHGAQTMTLRTQTRNLPYRNPDAPMLQGRRRYWSWLVDANCAFRCAFSLLWLLLRHISTPMNHEYQPLLFKHQSSFIAIYSPSTWSNTDTLTINHSWICLM